MSDEPKDRMERIKQDPRWENLGQAAKDFIVRMVAVEEWHEERLRETSKKEGQGEVGGEGKDSKCR